MPPVSEMTDEEVIEKCRNKYTFGGFPSDHMHELLIRALPLVPDDPIVNGRALQLWYHFAMPVADGYSSAGPRRAEGIPLHRKALENAERIVASTTAFDTAELRALFFWAKQTRMLLRLTAPSVTAEELATAGAESDAVYEEVLQKPDVGDEEKRIEGFFRTMCSARRRALELVAAGPPYPAETVELLEGYLASWDWNYGWPVVPLVTDATFRAYAANVIAERTATKSHPVPKGRIRVENLTKYDDPSPEELEGRLLLLFWLGMDQATFTTMATDAIEERATVVLDRLLALGFDVNALNNRGTTLLHTAVAEANVPAIRQLLAAGADPKKKVKKESALDLAKKKKRAAVIKAFEGGAGTSSREGELAAKLRAAAAALAPADLRWIGSTFGVDAPDPTKILEQILAKQPETPQEILADANAMFVFDRYVIARILRDAGYVIDAKVKGGLLTKCVTASGTVTVEGDLVDEMGSTIVTPGDLVVNGGMITEGDTIVGGTLRVRDYIWGWYNDGSLVVDTGVETPLLVMTDHTFECEGSLDIERTVVDDNSEHRTIFVPAILDEHANPDHRKAKALVKKGAPVVLGVVAKQVVARKAAANAKKAAPTKKAIAKKQAVPNKKAAPKKPAKKPAAKQPVRKAPKSSAKRK